MKFRKHHNNYGKQTIKTGRVKDQLKRICRKLNLPYGKEKEKSHRIEQADHMFCDAKEKGKGFPHLQGKNQHTFSIQQKIRFLFRVD